VVAAVAAAGRLAPRRGALAAVAGWVVIALVLAAATHARNDDYRSAQGIWEDVAAKRPNNDRAATWVASFAARNGDIEAAEREYRKAVRLAPTRVNWEKLGTFLLTRGRIDDARAAFDGAVTADRNGDGYASRAWFRSEVGDLDGALRDADDGVGRCPASSPVLPLLVTLRGQIHDKAGRRARAIADFTRAIALDPLGYDAYFRRGILRAVVGDTAGAIADYSEAMRLDPEEPEYYIRRAELYHTLRKSELVFDDLDAAIRLAPRPRYLYVRGDLLQQQGRTDAAVADLTRAIDAAPDVKEAYLARGLCYAQTRRPDLARADLLRYQKLGGQLDQPLKNLLARARP
jgi:tetratricopeptide (TPR) repeat protein